MNFNRRVLCGSGAIATATKDFLFQTEISPEAFQRLCRAGRIPEELHEDAAEWIDTLITVAEIEVDAHNDREGSTFTRQALLNMLTRYRRQVARGESAPASGHIEQHLRDAEIARLRHERLGDRWWGPIARATPRQFLDVCREANRRVKESRTSDAALVALSSPTSTTAMRRPYRARLWTWSA